MRIDVGSLEGWELLVGAGKEGMKIEETADSEQKDGGEKWRQSMSRTGRRDPTSCLIR